MKSRRTVTSVALGLGIGVVGFLIDSLLFTVIPTLRGWLPGGRLMLLMLPTLGAGLACAMVVHFFVQAQKRIVFVSLICSYALIEIAITVWMLVLWVRWAGGPWSITGFALTFVHVALFSVGPIVGSAKATRRIRRSAAQDVVPD